MKKPKDWQPGNVWHNRWLALRGNRFEDDVWDFVIAWQHLFSMRPRKGEYRAGNMKYYGFTKAMVERRYEDLIKETSSLVAGAIQSRDVSFLRELADLVEAQEQQYDRLRDWLLAVHFNVKGEQVHHHTAAELVKMAVERGIEKFINARRINELCDELGIKRKPDRRGRHKVEKRKKSTGELRK
ncbi:MAG: hypothetical protein EBS05_15105 [Proteobacteria bacterium]|nr:hypothetical protein [Pseudomonadota bacterium]